MTKLNYIADLNIFNNFIKKKNGKAIILDDLSSESLSQYIKFLEVQKKASTKTIKRTISTFRKLCSYLKNDLYLETNSAYKLDINNKCHSKPQTLEVDKTRYILEYVRLKAIERDIVIFSLFINTGIQVHELINLKKDDITLAKEEGSITINRRTIPLPPKTIDDINRYEQNNYISNHYFIGQRGRMTNSGIYRVITKYGELNGIKITPRIFRNSFIDRLYKLKVNENIIRCLIGKELNFYLQEPSYKEIKKAIYMCEL